MWTRTILALALASLAACAGPSAQRRSSRLVGQQLALTLPDLEGGEVDIASQGGAVRVVDFWATWCEPCKEAMPILDGLVRELGPRGFRVYGVSIDDDPAVVTKYLRERPVTFPILVDPGGVKLATLGPTFMPVTLLVDRRGVVRYVHQGWDRNSARTQREEIEALLREP